LLAKAISLPALIAASVGGKPSATDQCGHHEFRLGMSRNCDRTFAAMKNSNFVGPYPLGQFAR